VILDQFGNAAQFVGAGHPGQASRGGSRWHIDHEKHPAVLGGVKVREEAAREIIGAPRG
jgi:hypothetical protein